MSLGQYQASKIISPRSAKTMRKLVGFYNGIPGGPYGGAQPSPKSRANQQVYR